MYHDHFEGWRRPKRGRPLFALAMVALVAAPFAVEFVKPELYPDAKGPWAVLSSAVMGSDTATAGTEDLAPEEIPEIEEAVDQVTLAMGGEISPEMANAIRLSQAEQLMDPASSKSLGELEKVKRLYNAIHPQEISIPSSIPDLTRIVTVADAMNSEDVTGDLEESPVMRYALGEGGISPEMEAAFRTVKKAKEGELTGLSEQEIAALARERIGYVPLGVALEDVAPPKAADTVGGRTMVEGMASVISAHQIMINDTLVRLEGVRAPSYNEVCTNAAGAEYDCVSWSMEGMKYVIGGKAVSCAVSDMIHEEGGKIGRCRIDQNSVEVDLAKVGVRAGILIAAEGLENESPSAYLSDMELAKNNSLGLWSGKVADRNSEEPIDEPIEELIEVPNE